MDLRLRDKVAIVTGGAKGIGEGIVRSLTREGAKVAILSRSGVAGEKLSAELNKQGYDTLFLPTELVHQKECEQSVEQVISHYKGIDILVNNAGVNDGVSLRSNVDEFRQSLEKNLIQVFFMTQLCLDELIKTKGNIINIGSKTSDTGQGGTNGYTASKGGMNSLTREWALGLEKYGIRVNSVIPAEVFTPQYEKWLKTIDNSEDALKKIEKTIPFGNRMTTKEEIADFTAFIASPLSSHTTGQIFYIDGGYVHLDRAYTSK